MPSARLASDFNSAANKGRARHCSRPRSKHIPTLFQNSNPQKLVAFCCFLAFPGPSKTVSLCCFSRASRPEVGSRACWMLERLDTTGGSLELESFACSALGGEGSQARIRVVRCSSKIDKRSPQQRRMRRDAAAELPVGRELRRELAKACTDTLPRRNLRRELAKGNL